MNYKHQPGDIITLWYDWHDYMGELVEYQFQGRWTAKSLIITVTHKPHVPPPYYDRFIVPRKEAMARLDEYGYVWVGGYGRWLYLEPEAVRNADKYEAAKQAQEQQKAEADAKKHRHRQIDDPWEPAN